MSGQWEPWFRAARKKIQHQRRLRMLLASMRESPNKGHHAFNPILCHPVWNLDPHLIHSSHNSTSQMVSWLSHFHLSDQHTHTPADTQTNHVTSSRVRTDLGTDSGPHLVLSRLAQCQSVFVDRHGSKSTSNLRLFCCDPLLSTWVVALHAEFDHLIIT